MQYNSRAAATGSTLLIKNALTASLLVIRENLLPRLHYTKQFGQRPGRTENHLQTICEQSRIHSSSCRLCCSCSFGMERRASTFCLIVLYSWASLLAVRYSARSESFLSMSAASSFSMRSAEGTGTASSFFSSLAAASNKMISLSWPRRNFSLSLDWR